MSVDTLEATVTQLDRRQNSRKRKDEKKFQTFLKKEKILLQTFGFFRSPKGPKLTRENEADIRIADHLCTYNLAL